MATITLIHKTLGLANVDADAFHKGDPADGHGWTKAETEERGYKVATEKDLADEAARIAALTVVPPVDVIDEGDGKKKPAKK